jgi:murein DD-endopeptidase MepM/ murein hydrolase activator NlpD
MAWRRSHYVAASALAAAALFWSGHAAWSRHRPLSARPIVVDRAYTDFADSLGRRETVSDVLARAGITGADYAGFLKAAKRLEVRRLRPGLVFHFRRLHTEPVVSRVMVRPTHDRRLWLVRGDAGWVETEEQIPWTITRSRITGQIQSSLYDALDAAVPDSVLPVRERVMLAWAIADVYDWEVDFTRDVREGDRFEVLFERLQSPEGERRFGRILAARVDAGKAMNYAFHFVTDTGSGEGGFYDEHGRSLRRAFLRAPLHYRHVSSRFGARYHPILHVWRNHAGVDFSAPYGTPVRATADGVVTRVAYEGGGYGNYIELRHVNGIRTRYGHLSKFAHGLRVGERVAQEQTIGFVGSTGLSTGPHLHYEFLVNGRATNPQRKDMGAGTPVPPDFRSAYDAARLGLLALLEPPPSPSRVRPAPPPVVAAATPAGRD